MLPQRISPLINLQKVGMNAAYSTDNRRGLRPILQTYNVGTSSTSDSSDPDAQRRRARILIAGSETTGQSSKVK